MTQISGLQITFDQQSSILAQTCQIMETLEVGATHDTTTGMQTATPTSGTQLSSPEIAMIPSEGTLDHAADAVSDEDHDDSKNIIPSKRRLEITPADSKESNSMDSNVFHTHNMPSNKMGSNSTDLNEESTHAQDSLAEGKRPSIAPQEAIRRGLSFGPLKKPGSMQSSVPSILKAKSKSKSSSSRLAQKSLSSASDVLSTEGVGSLQKDFYPHDIGDEKAVDSSDDDDTAESSGDDAPTMRRPRARIREGGPGRRSTPRSPLAGHTNKPAVAVTGPENEQPKQTSAKRFAVHPNTNFDRSISRPASPHTSDSEELNDIRRAQNLNISSSPIDSSVPHRVIQTIIRGDFARMQEEAEEDLRRVRTYLVATDLSSEAAYALEWTIGTVLRDGDTLLAVYAVDEEVGTGVAADSLPVGEGAKAMQDTAAVMEKLTIASQRASLISPLSKATFRPGSRKSSAANSTDSRALSKAEQERAHAIEKLSETCLRFLRKTKLQVRIAIEVIHCKSPKYMITEAVSYPHQVGVRLVIK
jgi:hypothetical protein